MVKMMLSHLITNNRLILTRCMASSSSSTIINKKLNYFDSVADKWWESGTNGFMKHFPKLEHLRTQFICDQLKLKRQTSQERPLKGFKIVDVGCGVGIASERLALLGAEVTGFDPSKEAIKTAKSHASTSQLRFDNLNYLASTAEEFVQSAKGLYDVAVIFLVLEYVQNRPQFLNNCLQFLKPNGSVFILHASRTLQTALHLFVWHQYITRSLPRQLLNNITTVRTSDILDVLCKENGCELVGHIGLRLNVAGTYWYPTNSDKYYNLLHLVKKSN